MLKGGIFLSEIGFIQVHAYTSIAELPLQDVALTITRPDNTAVAMRLTNSSGQIIPVEISGGEFADSQAPNPDERPYTTYNLFARKENYEQINIYGLQVFPGITTEQNLEFIPLAEFPDAWDESESFVTPPQDL